MRVMTYGFCGALVVSVGALVAVAQRPGPAVRQAAPTDRAADFPEAELAKAMKEMDDGKLQTLRLLEGGKYSVNIRRLIGAESALVHGKTTDVWVVREGSGTLVTGGSLIDEKAGANGDASGTGIRGGTERVIKAGDLVFIPAGVPHGVRESKSITWLNIRFDTK
jgi:mannose-6-phosphate isomerase-like protein (cupin superfamily)